MIKCLINNEDFKVKKIYVNPKVPSFMDSKDINDRSESHLAKWFNRAYIRTQDFGEDNYQKYCERMAYTQEEYKLDTEEEFNTRRAKDLKSWCEHWVDDGIRYDVRILDGGAWDRTTNKGSYKTIEEAMEVAKELMSGPTSMNKFNDSLVVL